MKIDIEGVETPQDLPQIGSTLTSYTYEHATGDVILGFHETRSWYARSLIARPKWLLGWAIKLAWMDFKGLLRGAPKRPIERVSDALERR